MRKTGFLIVITTIGSATLPLTAAHAENSRTKNHPAQDPNRVICRTVEKTGSLIAGERKCMTHAEWEKEAVEHRRAVEEWRNGKSTGGQGGG